MRIAALLLLAACSPDPVILPPNGHVLLHVDTDAPVPSSVDPNAPPPLFDRLLVEIFAPGEQEACDGCVAELDLDRDTLLDGGSFAIVPPGPAEGVRVRLRMFLDSRRIDGLIAPEAIVEAVAALPPIPAEGPIEASVFLATESVGFPVGSLEAPIAADASALSHSRVGSWPPAQRVGCAEQPPAGAVCVPSGAFFMGHPSAEGQPGTFQSAALSAATRQRLVALSPFFLDVREATVADIRASRAVPPSDIFPWSGGSTGSDLADWCPYPTIPDPAREDLPMACITWRGARKYCQSRGGDLPTEAQLEYVAGALESRFYPWGSEEPDCDDTVWARRGGSTMFVCGPPEGIGGALPLPADVDLNAPPPPRTRDRVVLPDGVIFDLAGNQTEWARDYHQQQDEPCWSTPTSNVFINPECTTPGAGLVWRTFRSGSWADAHARVPSAPARRGLDEVTPSVLIGVRCAYPATP